MPILPTYTADAQTGYSLGYHSGGRRADDSDYAGGEGLRTVAKAANHAIDEVGAAESRKAIVDATDVRAQYAQRLDKAAISGEDLGAIKEQMNTDLAKVGEGLYTPQGQSELRLHSAQTNMMFDNQASSIAVHRAAVDAHVQAGKFLNSTAALFQSDPSYLPFAVQDAERLAESFVNVPAEQRREIAAKMTNELNVAAAVASARLQPKETLAKLNAGQWELSPEQRQHAIAHADQTLRAQRADEHFQQAQKDHDRKELSDKASDETFKKIYAGTITQDEIMNDPRLDQADREHQIRNLYARAKELQTESKPSNPDAYRKAWLAVHAEPGAPNKIYNGKSIYALVDSHANGGIGLNTADADRLLTQLAQQKDENNVSLSSKLRGMSMNFDRAIAADPRMLRFDATAKAEIQNDYVARVQERIEDFRNANQNPNDVFDPKSKSYVGSREFMQQSIDAQIAKQNGALPKGVDLRTTPNATIAVGDHFIDSKGREQVMTQQAFDARHASATKPNTFRSEQEKEVDKLYGSGQTPTLVKTPPPVDSVTATPLNYGKREDGTDKGNGYFGPLKTTNGNVATEISIGVNLNGKETQIPTLVPTLTKQEVDHLLGGGKPTEAIVSKAVEHAKQRIKYGKSPFAQPGEAQVFPGHPDYKTDSKPDPGNEWAPILNWMFGDDKKQDAPKPKPSEVPGKRLDDKEKAKVLDEFKKFKSISQNGKNTELQRENALREMIKRALRLGATRQYIEHELGRPLSHFGM